MRSVAFLLLLPLIFGSSTQTTDGGPSPGLGIEAPSASASRPAASHWEGLIGDWDIVFEALDAEGNVVATYPAEWNFHYILGGAAVQDAFFLPPRTDTGPVEGGYVGTALRVVDPETGTWRSTWADTDLPGFESWEGTSEPGRIRFHRTHGETRQEAAYWVDVEGRFRWEQREQAGDGDWVVTQRATGVRG